MSEQQPVRKNPYVGPRAFLPGERLYGRDRESDELLDLVLSERLVIFHAPSGAGKTSLLQANLLGRLADEGLRVLPLARVKWRPPAPHSSDSSYNPYAFSAKLDLSRKPGSPASDPATSGSDSHWARFTKDIDLEEFLTQEVGIPADELQVLIFDQFEELLTCDANDVAGKHEFCRDLGRLLHSRSRFAVFSMREDFVGALEPYLGHFSTRLAARYRLDFLTPNAAKLAIESPVKPHVQYEDKAVEKLVDDLRRVQVQVAGGKTEERLGVIIEPVHLQVVCTRIWNGLASDQTSITVKHLEKHGNVDRALRSYYADSVAEAAQKGKSAESDLRYWIGSELIVNRLRAQALKGSELSRGVSADAVEVLENKYVIRRDERRSATWFELAHDRLVVPVLADNAEWQAARGDWLENQAMKWREHQDRALLLKFAQAPRALSSARAMTPAQRARIDDYMRASAMKLFFGAALPFALLMAAFIIGLVVDSAQTRAANRGQAAALDSVRQLLAVNSEQRESLRNLVDSLTSVQNRYIYQRAWGLDSGSSMQAVQQSIQANQVLQSLIIGTTPDQRATILVRYYQKSKDKQRIEFALRELGYEVEVLSPLARADLPTNSVGYGPSVPLRDLKLIALTLVRGGTEVRSICPVREVRDRARVVEVTYSARLATQRPIQLDEINALTGSRPELNCVTTATPRSSLVR
jgi:hypothetical protein